MDVSKAFDSIFHSTLLNIFKSIGMALLEPFLKSKKKRVRISNTPSDEIIMTKVVH